MPITDTRKAPCGIRYAMFAPKPRASKRFKKLRYGAPVPDYAANRVDVRKRLGSGRNGFPILRSAAAILAKKSPDILSLYRQRVLRNRSKAQAAVCKHFRGHALHDFGQMGGAGEQSDVGMRVNVQ